MSWNSPSPKWGASRSLTATAFRPQLYGDDQYACSRFPRGAGELKAAKLPKLRIIIQIGGPRSPGTIAFDDVAERGATGIASPSRRCEELQFDDPITSSSQRYNQDAQGVTLTHHNILQQGYFVGVRWR